MSRRAVRIYEAKLLARLDIWTRLNARSARSPGAQRRCCSASSRSHARRITALARTLVSSRSHAPCGPPCSCCSQRCEYAALTTNHPQTRPPRTLRRQRRRLLELARAHGGERAVAVVVAVQRAREHAAAAEPRRRGGGELVGRQRERVQRRVGGGQRGRRRSGRGGRRRSMRGGRVCGWFVVSAALRYSQRCEQQEHGGPHCAC